jgi:hypothetical protein
MENVIVKYSDFFFNDGGFENLKKDFVSLKTALLKEADELKDGLKIIDSSNNKDVLAYEKRIEELTDTLQEYKNAQVVINKLEKQHLVTKGKIAKADLDTTKALDKLNVELEQHKVALKAVNKLEKEGKINIEEATVARGKARLLIKDLTREIGKQENELISLTKATKEEIKLAEAKTIIDNKQIGTLAEVRKRIAALRLVASQINIEFEEGKNQVKDYNREIDSLTDTLSDNSDKFIKNKINVGNYKESVIEALQSVSLFSGELSFLNGISNKLIGTFKRNTEATDANAKSVTGLGRATKALNNVAKATGILLLISAVAGLASVFKQGRQGAIETEKVLGKLAIAAKVAVNFFFNVGSALFGLFKDLGGFLYNALILPIIQAKDNIKLLGLELKLLFLNIKDSLPSIFSSKDKKNSDAKTIADTTKEIETLKKSLQSEKATTNFTANFQKLKDAVASAKDEFANATRAIDTLDEAAIARFEIGDRIKKTERALITLRREANLLDQNSKDNTLSLNKNLESSIKLREKNKQIAEAEEAIALNQLKIANAQARADVKARGLQGKFSDFDDDRKFAEDLLKVNIDLDERKGENTLDDEALTAVTDAYNALLEKEQEAILRLDDLEDQRRQLAIAAFDTNTTLFLKVFESQKDQSEELIQGVSDSIQKKLIEFDRLRQLVIRNATDEIGKFNKLGEELERKGNANPVKLDVKFDENGRFEIFNNGIKLSTDNIQTLTKELNDLDFPTSVIERFGKFLDKTRDQTLSMRALNKELDLAVLKTQELFEAYRIDTEQTKELDDLNDRIRTLRLTTTGFFENEKRNKILEELTKLENEKTEIEERGEFLRQQNRLKFIDKELEGLKSFTDKKLALENERALLEQELTGTNDFFAQNALKTKISLLDQEIDSFKKFGEKELELLKEQNDIKQGIVSADAEKQVEKTKIENQKRIAEYKKFVEELKQVFQEILDKITEVADARIDKSKEEVEKQKTTLSQQEERAKSGLTNTLAFEQKELAKREAEVLKQEKRKQRLEKIKALYSSYNAYASKEENPNQAVFKALRDFAILEGIAASFGDGGLVADKIDTDAYGITRGRSHKGQHGGIPVMVEGGEGFFSAKEVKNMGHKNFYRMKEMANMNTFDPNLFSNQRREMNLNAPIFVNDNSKLIKEMQEVKMAIESKPSQSLNVPEVVDGILKFTETIYEKNKVKRNHYGVNKSRL